MKRLGMILLVTVLCFSSCAKAPALSSEKDARSETFSTAGRREESLVDTAGSLAQSVPSLAEPSQSVSLPVTQEPTVLPSADQETSPSKDLSVSQDASPSAENSPSVSSDPAPEEHYTPIIYINTENGASIPDTKEEIACTVTLKCSDARFCGDALGATVRCRGNGSLHVGRQTGKYPYKLKFEEKINVFGIGEGKAKDWVLLAHAGDQTMLRNYAAKLLGDLLEGIPYSPNACLVNVYLSGEYIGVYELSEQVEVKGCRVNIDDTLTGRENGFLVELDHYALEGDADDVFFSVGGRYYTVKSDIQAPEQLDYIREYIEKVHNAILGADRQTLESLVDVNSLVDMYILQEFAKNIDAGFSSFYMYREADGKLFFAPPWDFDLAFGNDGRLDRGSYEELYIGTGRAGFIQNHEWYIQLYAQEWFRELVRARWQPVSEKLIPQVIAQLRTVSQSVAQDMDANYERWHFLRRKIQQEPDAIVKLGTYQQHVEYLINWMQQRRAWLDEAFK